MTESFVDLLVEYGEKEKKEIQLKKDKELEKRLAYYKSWRHNNQNIFFSDPKLNTEEKYLSFPGEPVYVECPVCKGTGQGDNGIGKCGNCLTNPVYLKGSGKTILMSSGPCIHTYKGGIVHGTTERKDKPLYLGALICEDCGDVVFMNTD